MNKHRHIDNRESRWGISQPTTEDPTLIVCPKCNSKAVVLPAADGVVKASCITCGFTNSKTDDNRAFYWHDENPTDGYFGYDLWLQIICLGNSLWAFNNRHLDILESYISADLRQRENDEKWGWQNSSLTSRLPKWIKSSKNRGELLKSLSKLREKA